MRPLAALFTAVALTAVTQANADTAFDNVSVYNFLSSRSAGSSPLAAITVGSTQQLNQISAYLDPASSGDLKFLVFDLGTRDLLFSTAAASFTDVGLGYYSSATFTPFQLNPGITYGIGAVANVSGLWGVGTRLTDSFTQGVFTASNVRNGNVATFGTPVLDADGFAMGVVQLGVAPVPEPGTIALFAAGLAVVGGMASRRKNAG